jgi:hypothetical protein
MSKRIAIILIALAIACQGLVVQASPSRQQQTKPAPTGLALEVTYYKDRPPAYLTVPGPESKLNGAWFGLFRRVPSWQPPLEALPVRAVNVLSRLEGDSVRIEVSVYLGVRFFEKEQPVATYRVRENEKISVDGLTRFGAEPFEIKVLRVNPIITNLPSIVNKTDSIEVVGVKANDTTFPSYTVTVRNLSSQNVAALEINLLVNGQNRGGSLPRRRNGKPLIETGATQEIFVLGAKIAQETPGGYVPDSPPNQEILISTAVFEDGSYEGEAETAARFKGFESGSKIQVPRLIALLQEAVNSTDQSVVAQLEKLKAQAAALSTHVETTALNDLQKDFPALTREAKASLKTSIEVALAGEKFEFLKRIQEFEKTGAQSSDANAFRAWLSASKESYEKWLSQLQSE